MINFEEELKKFEPSLEIDEAEELIMNKDLTDIMDVLKSLMPQEEVIEPAVEEAPVVEETPIQFDKPVPSFMKAPETAEASDAGVIDLDAE